MKLKDEVGMAGPRSTQTKFLGIIISNVHPYACFSRLSMRRTHPLLRNYQDNAKLVCHCTASLESRPLPLFSN